MAATTAEAPTPATRQPDDASPFVGLDASPFAASELPRLEALFRPHHRSGAFGTNNGSANRVGFRGVGARCRS